MSFVREEGYTREQGLASVAPGWAKLINKLFDAKPKDTVVVQVKEKFGGLRFYTGPCPEEFHKLISATENESYTVCEVCGDPGKLNTNRSWVKTLCIKCDTRGIKK